MSPSQQSPLRQAMIRELQLQGKGEKTIQVYVNYVAELSKHYDCSPDRIATGQLRDFLHHLITLQKLGRSAINVRLAAYRFFFEQVLGSFRDSIPRITTAIARPNVSSTPQRRRQGSSTETEFTAYVNRSPLICWRPASISSRADGDRRKVGSIG